MREERQRPKLAGRWKFLLLMLAAYLLVGWLEPALARTALAGFKGMFLKVLTILGLVFVALLLVNLLLNPERIRQHLGRDSGSKAGRDKSRPGPGPAGRRPERSQPL
jgi:hypothetical protein